MFLNIIFYLCYFFSGQIKSIEKSITPSTGNDKDSQYVRIDLKFVFEIDVSYTLVFRIMSELSVSPKVLTFINFKSLDYLFKLEVK